MSKICKECKLEKDESEFYPRHAICKVCSGKRRKESRKKYNYSSRQRHFSIKSQVCSACLLELSIDNFNVGQRMCKECRESGAESILDCFDYKDPNFNIILRNVRYLKEHGKYPDSM